MPTRTALLGVFVLLAAPACADARPWLWPVKGDVVEGFVRTADPFAPGQHRGVDLAAPAGAPVRAACAGRVRIAGTAASAGRTVSVRCGSLVASYLHLASIAVRPGQRLARGERIGTVGATGRSRTPGPHLHFGVRRATDRFGYLDPLDLLGDRPLGPAPAPLPTPRRPVPPLPVPASRLRLPATTWGGVALLALAVPGLVLVRGRRRRRGRRVAITSAARWPDSHSPI